MLSLYLRLKKNLEEVGFVMNDCDPCVTNKLVNGSQMTVVFHADDLRVLHKDPFQITM